MTDITQQQIDPNDAGSATLWVTIAYSDASGEHAVGDQVTFNDDDAIHLIEYGILSTVEPPKPVETTHTPDSQGSQPTAPQSAP